MKNFFKEFRTFATRGNAVELAVAVLIGASFNQVTTALSANILTPLIGLFGSGFDFAKLALHLGPYVTLEYGVVIQAIVNFLITALILFTFLKGINRLARLRKEEEKKEEKDSAEVVILKEIRDELKKRS